MKLISKYWYILVGIFIFLFAMKGKSSNSVDITIKGDGSDGSGSDEHVNPPVDITQKGGESSSSASTQQYGVGSAHHDETGSSSNGDVGKEANNPFNLRQTTPSQKWQGEIGTKYVEGDSVGFVDFADINSGVRAGSKNAIKQIKAGFNTPLKYLKHESPASDGNNPVKYANYIQSVTNIAPNDKLDLKNKDKLIAFFQAINHVEWGKAEPVPHDVWVTEINKLL